MGLKKIIPIFVLLMLLITPAFAATLTATWHKPTDGQVFNNLPANVHPIDVNFAWTDDNADAGSDLNVDYIKLIRRSNWATIYTFKTDANIFDANQSPTAAWTCDTVGIAGIAGSCNYHWDTPTNTTLGDDYYCLDVNVVSYFEGTVRTEIENDINALRCFYINNGFSQAAAIRAIATNFGLVLGAAVLFMGLFSVTVLKTDVKSTALVTIVAAIVVAIGSMVIGTVIAMI